MLTGSGKRFLWQTASNAHGPVAPMRPDDMVIGAISVYRRQPGPLGATVGDAQILAYAAAAIRRRCEALLDAWRGLLSAAAANQSAACVLCRAQACTASSSRP